MWDPGRYLDYREERARPFHDLLARVDVADPRLVVDLGCGPGNLTTQLADRWPGARIQAVDNSPDMVRAAEQARLEHPAADRIDVQLGDARNWRPDQPADLLVSNAVLQWVPGYLALLPELLATLRPGGWLALQVPANFDAPHHQLLHQVAARPRWRDRALAALADRFQPAEPLDHLRALAGAGRLVDVWETTYLHLLPGPDGVLRWTSGTAARPVLAALDPAERAEFLAEYGAELGTAYPVVGTGDGQHAVLPFRRSFAVVRTAA